MSNSELSALFFLQMAAIIATCRLVGWLARRFLGQPQVVGEMIAGVVLGPSLLGWIAPGVEAALFPAESKKFLYIGAQLGVGLYMFLVGLTFDRMVAPFAVAAVMVSWLIGLPGLFTPQVSPTQATLFLGAAIAITAFPMLARIIHERGLAGTRMGTLSLSAGALGDAGAWVVVAMVLASLGQGPEIAIKAAGGGLTFALVMVTIAPRLLKPLEAMAQRRGGVDEVLLALALGLFLLCAWAMDAAGMHAVFGGFLLGTAMPRGAFAEALRAKLEPFATVFLLPMFFTFSGLNTQLQALGNLNLLGATLAIIAAAIIAKGGACYVAARLAGEDHTTAMGLGALMCSLGLFLMPHSTSLLMAASLLWLLDAGNNTTMEPYRAYVSDRLDADQHEIGFLSQSAFTGLAQCLAFLTPSILVYWFGFDRNAVDAHNIPQITHISFLIGAVLSLSTILWSVLRVPELPLTEAESAHIAAAPRSALATLTEIGTAIAHMPKAMRQMAWMSLFQWYGFSIYWSYASLSIGRSVFHTADKTSAGFRDAVLTTQQLGAFYNLVGFGAAFAMVPISRRLGASWVHMGCLTLAGISLLYLPLITAGTAAAPALLQSLAMPELGRNLALMIPAVGLGLGWASIMGNPYVILAGSIPPERTGVYMGIFNMMIVIPMLINGLTFGPIYRHFLANDPRHALSFAGVLLLCAALTMIWVKSPTKKAAPAHG